MPDLLPGITIAMGGRDWIVPPLTLGQLRRLLPKVADMGRVDMQMDDAQLGVVVEIVGAALRRNYPEITDAQIEEMLDMGNAQAVMDAVRGGSGLRQVRPGEVRAAGNGTGPISMASSPPASATGLATSTN
jgi:hypothetical protein